MAFFCPIFPKHHNKHLKAKEYEDSNNFSFGGAGRRRNLSRSMTALNFFPREVEENDYNTSDASSPRLMLVISDFDPTVDDELRVRKGDVVKAMYRDREWMYVVRDNGKNSGGSAEGFIPLIYCQDLNGSGRREGKDQRSPNSGVSTVDSDVGKTSDLEDRQGSVADSSRCSSKDLVLPGTIECEEQTKRIARPTIRPKALINVDRFLRSLEENKKINSDERKEIGHRSSARYAAVEKYGMVMPFHKQPCGQLIAEFDFIAQHENDLDIEKGDVLLLLNKDDPDWYWVKKKNGMEGFVPSNYVRIFAHCSFIGRTDAAFTKSVVTTSNQIPRNELLVVADVEPESVDDLRVVKGDWIYSHQLPSHVPDWIWAYCIRTKRYGFVPSSKVRVPLATDL